MLIAVILLGILSVSLIIYIISYRRQVRSTCRQLDFMRENTTNLRLTNTPGMSELNELKSRINEFADSIQKISVRAMRNENALKETITHLSHDIRTPLTSLDGYFQLLTQSNSPEDRKRYTSIIQRRLANLTEMLELLFTYTKLQNENFELELTPVDFSKSGHEAVFSFYDELQQYSSNEPEIIFADGRIITSANEESLLRVLQNIIRNALLHGKDFIRLELREENGNAVFVCSNNFFEDNTPDPEKVFDRFYKADPARTKTSSGLGLAIAKGLTEKMNGSISAAVEDNLFSIKLEIPLAI